MKASLPHWHGFSNPSSSFTLESVLGPSRPIRQLFSTMSTALGEKVRHRNAGGEGCIWEQDGQWEKSWVQSTEFGAKKGRGGDAKAERGCRPALCITWCFVSMQWAQAF